MASDHHLIRYSSASPFAILTIHLQAQGSISALLTTLTMFDDRPSVGIEDKDM